jgi:hypothetical protein
VSAIKTYVERHRENKDPFDIVVILWSEGEGSPEELLDDARCSEAGATWWLEDLSTERFYFP